MVKITFERFRLHEVHHHYYHSYMQIIKYMGKTFRYSYLTKNGTETSKIDLLTDDGWVRLIDEDFLDGVKVITYVDDRIENHQCQFVANTFKFDEFLKELYGEPKYV